MAVVAGQLRPNFFGAARGELLKLSRQLSIYLMLLLGFVLLGVVVLATASASNLTTEIKTAPTQFFYDELDVYGTLFQVGGGIVILLVGARLHALDYSAGTVRILLARGLGRLELWLAKSAVLLLFGLSLLAGYSLLVTAILILTAQSHGVDGIAWFQHLPGSAWQDLGRWAVVQALSIVVCILLAAAAAGLGRSLAFAMAGALAVFPVDNFLTIILALAARATGHPHPWNDISSYLLGPNLNVLLRLWEPGHHSRPAFAAPLVTVDLTHSVVVITIFALALATIAIVRAVQPDVLE